MGLRSRHLANAARVDTLTTNSGVLTYRKEQESRNYGSCFFLEYKKVLRKKRRFLQDRKEDCFMR